MISSRSPFPLIRRTALPPSLPLASLLHGTKYSNASLDSLLERRLKDRALAVPVRRQGGKFIVVDIFRSRSIFQSSTYLASSRPGFCAALFGEMPARKQSKSFGSLPLTAAHLAPSYARSTTLDERRMIVGTRRCFYIAVIGMERQSQLWMFALCLF
jgi:hypothetical protein